MEGLGVIARERKTMSVVTDMILVTAIDDGGGEDKHPNADRLNAWIREAHGPTEALKKVDQHAGGNKAVQCDVFVGAINYLDEKGLIAAFRGVQWESPDCAQLMLKGEQKDRFTVYQLDHRGAVSMLNPDDAQAMRDEEL